MSINVGRSGATHDIALSRAHELGVDVVHIQEPSWDRNMKDTRSHPGYNKHIPHGGVDIRPRAATYTRKSKVITATQTFPCATLTGDYCWVVVNGVTFLNVYKAPNNPVSLRPLVDWTPSAKTIAVGDFNSVHKAWQPGATRPHRQGEAIEEWADKHKLSCLIIGEPTHRAGNTLDLAWSNIDGTLAWVDRSKCMTSDHLPIRGQVPTTFKALDTESPKIRVRPGDLPNFAQAVAQWAHPPPKLDTIDKVEKYAQELCSHLSNAIKATGTLVKNGHGKHSPWWTPKCKAIHAAYRAETIPQRRATHAKLLREAIVSAKKDYVTGKVQKMTTAMDVFKLMRSANPRQVKTPPPLSHNGSLVSDPAERATILRDALLARHESTDDLSPCTTPSENRIPWNDDVSEDEVRTCTIGCKKTAPGADGISVELLEACWKTIGRWVTQLFRACIRLGIHSACFKLAEVVLLHKPNRDPSTVKGWRPIALLSCLGKGLERLLAKRMARLAVTHEVVGHQQFGALPKRSATDLVSCVVHDIEEARSQGWAATFITLDVQGAFDAVLHNRLIRRMQSQGWPDSILRWTTSFLANRRVQVRYIGGVTTERELVCGVPQGSPISPLLFLLYMAEPMRDGNPGRRFSYADDVGVLVFGRTIVDSASAAQEEVNQLTSWAKNNAIAFDIDKSEVIQFPGHHREIGIGIHVNSTFIEPSENVRWLGVYLDSRLNFKHHVTKWCGKAAKAAHHMRRFNSTYRGAAPDALIRAVDLCIIPVATYGSEVWWPGLKRPTQRGVSTSQTTGLCSMIDKVISTGLRAALPVMRTTPTVVLQREGGIPPARIILEGNRLRLSARLKSLDSGHPLRRRAAVCPNIGTRKYKKNDRQSARPEIQMSRIQRAYQQLPEAESAEPLPALAYLSKVSAKEKDTEICKRWIESLPSSVICAYSDGASEGHGRSAWAFVLKRDGKTIDRDSGTIHGGEVLDAEIVGVRKALEAALQISGLESRTPGKVAQPIYVLTDSQHARTAMLSGDTSTSIKEARIFRTMTQAAPERIIVKWVPGHKGIQGNEEADAAARSKLRSLPLRDEEPQNISSAYLYRLMNQKR